MSILNFIRSRVRKILINNIAASCFVSGGLRNTIYRSQGIKIGKNVSMGTNIFIFDSNLKIAENSFINHHVMFQIGVTDAGVSIGKNVFVGPRTLFQVSTHEISSANQRAGRTVLKDIIIDDGTWIGCNVTILPGVHISEGCVIGAGAVVVKSTEPNGVYVGVPAKRIRDLR